MHTIDTLVDELIDYDYSNYTHMDCNSSIDTIDFSLLKGYIHVRVAWEKHCSCVSYETFRDFITAVRLPMIPLKYVSEYSGELVNSYQVHPNDVRLLKQYIIENSRQVTKTLYEHPDLLRRFRLTL